MVTTVRQLYASVNADVDNAASLQFVKRASITAIHLSAAANTIQDNSSGIIEVSLFPSFQGQTNDPNGPLLTLPFEVNLSTNGGWFCSAISDVSGIAIPVEPGMKAYLNAGGVSTVTEVICVAQLYVTSG